MKPRLVLLYREGPGLRMATVLAQPSHEQGTKMSESRPGLQGVCEGPEFRTSGLRLWQTSRTSLCGSQRLPDGIGAKPQALLPPGRQGGSCQKFPAPLHPAQNKQAQVAGNPVWQVGGAWAGLETNRGHLLTWSPWKGIPERETFKLKSQSIQPVFDDG